MSNIFCIIILGLTLSNKFTIMMHILSYFLLQNPIYQIQIILSNTDKLQKIIYITDNKTSKNYIYTYQNLLQQRLIQINKQKIKMYANSHNNSKSLISYQAFLQQLHNWQLTLTRQQKKLRTLRTKLTSKILTNQLEILITEIDAELIRYRKLKDINRLQKQGRDIIVEYNQNSKKFMECMENIGGFVEKVQGEIQDGVVQDTLELDEIQIKAPANNKFQKKKYQDETFAYSISKQTKQKNTSTKPNQTAKTLSKKPSSHTTSIKNPHPSLNHTLSKPSNAKKSAFISTSTYGSSSTQIDSWQIRYQLKQIKSLMNSIQNQIKYHTHQDIQSQLSKIQHNNKKMSLQLKSLKQDSQYIMTRIQKLKQQLVTQKQVQMQMIQQFENPQRNRKNKSKTHSVQNSRVKRDRDTTAEVQDGISDWVKARI